MKLLTKEIMKKMPGIGETESVPLEKKKCVVKFFTPWANWTWYVIKGELTEDGDWLFFGLVDGFEKEWGYFTLSDLSEVKGPVGLMIERDRYFDGKIPERCIR